MQLKNRNKSYLGYLPLFVSLLFFCIFLFFSVKYNLHKKKEWDKEQRSQLLETLIAKKIQLEKALFSRIYYTRGLAAYVSLNPDIEKEEYIVLAKEFIRNDSTINSMAISRDCILSAIYPMGYHEDAIGLNLLEHPERMEIVSKTIKTRKTFVAGPVELVEGGIAFISYTPVYYKAGPRNGDFWGIADIVILKDKLLNEAGFMPSENGFDFALKGYNGLGDKGAVFWGNEIVFEKNPVTVEVILPDGAWILAASPSMGWKRYVGMENFTGYLLILTFSILLFLLLNSQFKVRLNEIELRAILASMENLIIEFDKSCTYKKIAAVDQSSLYKPADELLGKTVFDVFENKLARLFYDSVQDCLKEKKLVVVQYKLEIEGNERWFSGRISYKTENSVIFNAFEITEQKITENRIINSEAHLRELNITKDKFFSIISHDLRAPFNSVLGFSQILAEQGDQLSPSDVKEIGDNLNKAAWNTYNLLQNLLEWSNTQTGKLIAKKTSFSLLEVVNENLELFKSVIELKNISVKVKIDNQLEVYADRSMIQTVMRNLLSNAFKYTNSGGNVDVFASKVGDFINVFFADNGTGINEKNIGMLFKIDSNFTMPGTNDEKGSGLGLVICKEFVQLNGGEIWVESKLGEGTTFHFSIPVRGN